MTDIEATERALASLAVSNPSRQLRALLPVIDERIRAGVPHSEIIAQLALNGIVISPTALSKRLYRWRQAQGTAVSASAKPNASRRTPNQPPLVPDQSIHNKADLVAMRSADIDLEALARLGKESNQE